MKSVLVALVLAVTTVSAQDVSAPVTPAFEAVVLKRNTSGSQSMSAGSQPGGVHRIVNGPISTIFGNAWPTESNQIIGAPDWFKIDRYDLVGRITGTPTEEQQRELWRAFFVERMKLKAHYETREQPAYALVLARSDGRLGPNVRPAPIDCAARRQASIRGEQLPPLPQASNGMPACSARTSGGLMQSGGQTMAALGRSISGLAGRFVVDRTGLAGSFEYTLEYSRQQPGEPLSDKPDVFTALQEQLGLKLEPIRAPVQVVVIDHIERPIVD
jgi:uncharacterized protein (TIGR03435 family)